MIKQYCDFCGQETDEVFDFDVISNSPEEFFSDYLELHIRDEVDSTKEMCISCYNKVKCVLESKLADIKQIIKTDIKVI
jgi:hypothetical protein